MKDNNFLKKCKLFENGCKIGKKLIYLYRILSISFFFIKKKDNVAHKKDRRKDYGRGKQKRGKWGSCRIR